MAVKQIVVGSTARDFAATLVKAADGVTPINPTSANLQGRSEQLHGVQIDAALTVGTTPNANVVSLAEFGNLINVGNLGVRPSALFTFRIRYVLGTKVDYTPEFQYEWVRGPL